MKFVARKDLSVEKEELSRAIDATAAQAMQTVAQGLDLDPIELILVMVEAQDAIRQASPSKEAYPVLARYITTQENTIKKVAAKFQNLKLGYINKLDQVRDLTHKLKVRVDKVENKLEANGLFQEIDSGLHIEEAQEDKL